MEKTKSVTNSDRIVWSNEDLDLEDWRDVLEGIYPGYSDDELYDMMIECNNLDFESMRYILNIQLYKPILMIEDIGRWDGRYHGYSEIRSGNISDCLNSGTDYTTWYIDKNGDFRCRGIHHDGTNHYLYRVYKDGVSETQIDNLKEKIIRGTVTRADIVRITKRIGDVIGKAIDFHDLDMETIY